MSTELNELVKGRVVVHYTNDRVKEMLSIKEKCCLASQRMIVKRMDDMNMDISKIHHADKPNGTIDLIIEFKGPNYNLDKLRKEFKELQDMDIGIGGIGVFTPDEVN